MSSNDARLRVVLSDNLVTLLDDGRPLPEANRFLNAVRARGLSPRTVRAYAFDLLHFYRWLSATRRQLQDLVSADLVDLIAEQQSSGAAPRSINRRLTTVRLLLGYEAARLVAAVATPETVDDWVTRAAKRTVRFLREEVGAAQMFERLVPEASAAPPSEATMQELAELESRIVSGTLFRELDRARELNAAARPAGQMFAGAPQPLGRARRARRGRVIGRPGHTVVRGRHRERAHSARGTAADHTAS